ncbi:fungal hydrophobin-domain-containing protein [Fomes fomentarius]|nr:fungal hydrophobin-domain-containing protein [Fomes fomentarius]
MFARFTTTLAVVSLVVLAAATPYPTNVPPPPKTVTQIATKIVTKTELVQPATVTQPSGTCTATAPIVTVTEPASNCTSGPIQCCESIEQANSIPSKVILGLLGIFLQDLNIILGLNCSPITGVGVGSGDACSAVTVCCENNAVGGLISIGCIPVFL